MDKTFDPASLRGLSESGVLELLSTEGFNELPSTKKRGFIPIAMDVVREPMFLLLLACGTIYLLAGEVQEALMLLGFVFVVMGITFFQERKTERALEALRDMSSPRALVIRDGEKKRIPGREVVRGDFLLLSEGDRVAADASLVSCTNLSVDESLLTGESVPVLKTVRDAIAENSRPGGDDLPFVYSGTLVVQGQGIAEVRATGVRTEIGKIGKALQILQQESTPLQKQTGKLVRTFAVIGALLCALVVVVFGVTRGNWLDGFLAGLSLAMAMLPEEFPVVLTIFLALGAWRISRHRVLTRRVPAVETLGSATVLCVDKTGTLTMNRMTVSDLCVNSEFYKVSSEAKNLPEEFHELVEYCILASPADPFDPMEKAMHELGIKSLSRTEHLHKDWELLREYPLSQELLAMSRVWRSKNHDHFVIAAKGAPEAIADICHLTQEQIRILTPHIDALSSQGRRIIGVAAADFDQLNLPEAQHDFNFRFIGLLGLEDPVRPGVSQAIDECYGAGVRTIMITGDYPGTAANIAAQIGLRHPNDIITGSELEKMSQEELALRIRSVNVFARMVPEQKLFLVKALKNNGEVVAMTGDGVNDAPALKAAHIGIAMGGRGTDVAREASSLVLLDDDFASIVKAVAMGRRIYDNLKKAMMYILSVHIPIAGMSLIPVLFKWPLALFPVHIVFLELIIDPACSVIFEAESAEKNVMKRPPRKLSESLFNRRAVVMSLIQGLLILGVATLIYIWAIRGHGENAARALSFTTLVVCNIGLILTNRSYYRSILSMFRVPNTALWWVVGGTAVMLACSLFIPFLQGLFRFAPVPPGDFLACLSAGLTTIFLMECLKTGPVQRVLFSEPSEKVLKGKL
jgi:P-type Ca2+ transporter type 2C